MTGPLIVLTLLGVFFFVLISSAIIYVRWWLRKFRQEHSDDVGSVTGQSTHSTASKEMMYFMCWENSSQVAALGVPVSPASTNKEPPAIITTHKEPPAIITTHKEPPAFVGIDMHPPPPASPPRTPPPPVAPTKPSVPERMELPPKRQAARDVDLNPPQIPPGYNVLQYKIYPNDNGTLFTGKDVLEDGERTGSSAAAGNLYRPPSTELVFTTPAQSPPFYTPVSSPQRGTIEEEVSNLHTSSSSPGSHDVVGRFYPKKVMFKEMPHVKIIVG